MKKFLMLIMLAGTVMMMSGCATHVMQATMMPTSAKVKLSTFSKIEVVKCITSDALRAKNVSAIDKIDENFIVGLKRSFPNVSQVDLVQDFSSGSQTLQIIPEIKDIKFIGGAARFMVGAMAGSSAVLISVVCKDSVTGDIVAQGEFYKSANAFGGGYSIGATDNLMLNQVVEDIVSYLVSNK